MKQYLGRIIVLAVFILALGLIFLPMTYDAPEVAQPPLLSRIPPPPEVPELPEPVQSRPVILSDTPAIQVPAGERAVAQPREAWREISTLDERGLPQGWSLGLGSFPENQAQQLLSQLMAAGFRAYLRVQESDPEPLHTVLVGPWLVQENARENQARLAQELGLTATIVPYALQEF